MAEELGKESWRREDGTIPQRYFFDPAKQGVKDIGTGIATVGKAIAMSIVFGG